MNVLTAVPHPREPLASHTLSADELRRIEEDGYIVLTGVLTDEECDELALFTDRIWHGENLGTLTPDLLGIQFCGNLLQYSAVYEQCVVEPRMLAAVAALLGPEFRLDRLMSRCVEPGYGNQALHDLARRRGRPFFKANVIWCIDEFAAENGATRVIPGSHLDDTQCLARMADPSLPHPDERVLAAPRGSVIVHSSHLIHGGTLNRSDSVRRSIHSAFTTPEVEGHTDWSALPTLIRSRLSPAALDLTGLRAR